MADLNFSVSNLCEAALYSIKRDLNRVMWNKRQTDYDSPFDNTGNVTGFKNDVFEVHAYDWNEETKQIFNFKWESVEISWYKRCGRGMSCNQELTFEKIDQMLNECTASLDKMDEETFSRLTSNEARKVSFDETELHVWFERDRQHIDLRYKDLDEESILEFWDDEVTQAYEDGFLQSHINSQLHKEMYDLAIERGFILEKE